MSSTLSNYAYDTSLLLEFLILLDRLLSVYFAPVFFIFLVFYKAYVKNISSVYLSGDFFIYLSFFFINITRLTAGSYGNKSQSLSLIVWFWLLGLFIFTADLYTLTGLQLLLTSEVVFTGFSLFLLLFEYLWSIANLLLSNTANTELHDEEAEENFYRYGQQQQEQEGERDNRLLANFSLHPQNASSFER